MNEEKEVKKDEKSGTKKVKEVETPIPYEQIEKAVVKLPFWPNSISSTITQFNIQHNGQFSRCLCRL